MFCYIHIPFCESKCKYCRFASLGNLQVARIEKYLNHLLKEIKRPVYKKTGLNYDKKLESVYFGGGTPSTLDVEQLALILKTIEIKFGFENDIEITLESTPNNITKQNLIDWKNIGINRLSIGLQTLNNKSLIEIGRGNKGDILEALDLVKSTILIIQEQQTSPQPSPQGEGVATELSISLDFIIGLPYVKKGEIKKDIEYILDNYDYVKHISVYMLEEYYSPDKIIETKYDNITYPETWDILGIKEEEYLGEYIEVKEFLKSRGFLNYEISNFAKTSLQFTEKQQSSIQEQQSSPQPSPAGEGVATYECSHNKAYWNHEEVVAFGLGAAGLVKTSPQPSVQGEGGITYVRYMNSDSFKGYYAQKELFRDKLTLEDIFLEKLMFQLRTSGVEKNIYDKLDKNKIDYFIKNGYLRKIPHPNPFPEEEGIEQEHILVLENKGVLVMDYILKELV